MRIGVPVLALFTILYLRTSFRYTETVEVVQPALRVPRSGKHTKWAVLVHLTGDRARYEALMQTWISDLASDAASVVFFGRKPEGVSEMVLHTMGMGQYADTRAAMAYALSAFPNAERFTKADDDSYVYVDNLRCYLDATNPEYGGYPLVFPNDGLVFASGGASYTLSRTSASSLVSECVDTKDASEDVAVGRCMLSLGIKLTDMIGLHPHDPWQMLRWDLDGHSPDHVRREEPTQGYLTPLSYHYVTPEVMYRMHAKTIPTRLHQIWIGTRPRPTHTMDACASLNQNWTYGLWTDESMKSNLPHGELVNQGKYDKGGKDWPLRADIARYEILMHFGGVYIDADSVCLKPLDEFLILQTEGFAAYESETRRRELLANGVLGSRPYSPLMILLVRELQRTNWKEPAWMATGPLYLTRTVQEFGLNLTKLPSKLFYPYHFEDKRPKNDSAEIAEWGSYTDQLWGSTRKNVYAKLL